MFLISRANSLPRRASLTAFWCLVVAHLEWPLIGVLSGSPRVFVARRVYVDRETATADGSTREMCRQSQFRGARSAGDHVDEQLMYAPVAGHLGVKRRRQLAALPHRDDMPGGAGQHLHAGTGALDPGRADEHRAHRVRQPRERNVTLERVDLTPKSVAPHRHIDSTQGQRRAPAGSGIENLTGQQDHAGARAVGGQPVGQQAPQRFQQAEVSQQVAHGRRLPTGDDQPVDRLELTEAAHGHRLGPGFAQGGQVLAGIALQRENPDPGGAHWLGGRWLCAKRVNPSCMTAATISPDWVKILPWHSARPPWADGEDWSYNSHSSARNARINHIAWSSDATCRCSRSSRWVTCADPSSVRSLM